MLGKMSIGVLTAAVTPKMTISIAITTKVYGLVRAIRTIASIGLFESPKIRHLREGARRSIQQGQPDHLPARHSPVHPCHYPRRPASLANSASLQHGAARVTEM